MLLPVLLEDGGLDLSDPGIAFVTVQRERVYEIVDGLPADSFREVMVVGARYVLDVGLSEFLRKLFLEFNYLEVDFLRTLDSLEHEVFGDLTCARFHHDHA